MYWSASIEISAPWRFSRIEDERLAAGDAGQRPREELEDLDLVLGLLLLSGGRRTGLAADGRAQLADLRELGKEGDQLRREIGEIGALG